MAGEYSTVNAQTEICLVSTSHGSKSVFSALVRVSRKGFLFDDGWIKSSRCQIGLNQAFLKEPPGWGPSCDFLIFGVDIYHTLLIDESFQESLAGSCSALCDSYRFLLTSFDYMSSVRCGLVYLHYIRVEAGPQRHPV